jgi:hypothetical protein
MFRYGILMPPGSAGRTLIGDIGAVIRGGASAPWIVGEPTQIAPTTMMENINDETTTQVQIGMCLVVLVTIGLG